MITELELWWEQETDARGNVTYSVLHVGQLSLTEVARLRRSNKGNWYFLEVDLPNYDLEHIELGEHTSGPFEEQKTRAEAWVRSWFKLAMTRKE
jgi:hypothetical protein